MAKIVVRLPEPKKEYTEDNQRQINRALSTVIEQLNSTYLTQLKEDQERYTWYGLGIGMSSQEAVASAGSSSLNAGSVSSIKVMI